MKKKIFKYLCTFSVFLILLILLLNHYMSYSIRIGDTRFYLIETMAMSKDGKPLLGLYCKDIYGGYKGVEMGGFPRIILWNDKYLISKNYDGKDTIITSYVIINQDSVNALDGDIAGLHIFKGETDYNKCLHRIGLSESKMKTINNNITWWEFLFTKLCYHKKYYY